MSKINDLIAEYCPDGVEFHSISEIFDLKNGYTPSKSKLEYWTNGTVPWFRMEDIRANGHILFDSIQHVNQLGVKNGKLFSKDSVMVATSATIGEHALLKVDALTNQRFTVLTRKPEYVNRLLPEFINYYCYVLDEWCKTNVHAGGFASVDMEGFKRYRFPVPPLPVQEEIVRILDSFSSLEAELEAELEARRKQYAYYRDQLIRDCPSIRWIPLSEISENCDKSRKPIKKEKRIAGKTPYYGASGVVDYVDGFTHEGDYLLLSEDGANLLARSMPIAYQISGRNWINNHAHVLRIENANLRQLVEMYLNSISLEPYITKGAQPKLTKQRMETIAVPVPSEDYLSRIVEMLTKFYALTTSLTDGLPAEIEARRKQYEYYRDRLLSFDELAV